MRRKHSDSHSDLWPLFDPINSTERDEDMKHDDIHLPTLDSPSRGVIENHKIQHIEHNLNTSIWSHFMLLDPLADDA